MKELFKKIKCFFGNHDFIIIKTKKVRGIFFGRIALNQHFVCKNCRKDGGWMTTESTL